MGLEGLSKVGDFNTNLQITIAVILVRDNAGLN